MRKESSGSPYCLAALAPIAHPAFSDLPVFLLFFLIFLSWILNALVCILQDFLIGLLFLSLLLILPLLLHHFFFDQWALLAYLFAPSAVPTTSTVRLMVHALQEQGSSAHVDLGSNKYVIHVHDHQYDAFPRTSIKQT